MTGILSDEWGLLSQEMESRGSPQGAQRGRVSLLSTLSAVTEGSEAADMVTKQVSVLMQLGQDSVRQEVGDKLPVFQDVLTKECKKARGLIDTCLDRVFQVLAKQMQAAYEANLAATREENRMRNLKMLNGPRKSKRESFAQPSTRKSQATARSSSRGKRESLARSASMESKSSASRPSLRTSSRDKKPTPTRKSENKSIHAARSNTAPIDTCERALTRAHTGPTQSATSRLEGARGDKTPGVECDLPRVGNALPDKLDDTPDQSETWHASSNLPRGTLPKIVDEPFEPQPSLPEEEPQPSLPEILRLPTAGSLHEMPESPKGCGDTHPVHQPSSDDLHFLDVLPQGKDPGGRAVDCGTGSTWCNLEDEEDVVALHSAHVSFNTTLSTPPGAVCEDEGGNLTSPPLALNPSDLESGSSSGVKSGGSSSSNSGSNSGSDSGSDSSEADGDESHTVATDKGSAAGASGGGDRKGSHSSGKHKPEEAIIKFEVLPAWNKAANQIAARMGTCTSRILDSRGINAVSNPLENDEEEDEEKGEQAVRKDAGIMRRFIVHPTHVPRGCWEAMSLFLVIYDMIFIPMQLLRPPQTAFSKLMDWVTRLFWTADMAASLLTGYTTADGFIEMRQIPIALRYLKTWFALDFLIIGIDWMEIFWAAVVGADMARVARASRAFRVVRMIRLLRLLRLKDLIMMMFEYARSESVKEMADMIKILMMIIGFAHLVACGWYGLGAEKDIWGYEEAWVTRAFNSSIDWDYRVKYLVALHWSLSQFSGGMDAVLPVNPAERLYAVFVYLVAFMMGAILVGSLTSSMTQLRMLANEKSTKLLLLRRYLFDNAISNRLALRVQRNAQHAMLEQQRYIPEHNVELLQMVSEPLRIELHFELYAKILANHPFFEEYILSCPHIMQKVCHSAASMAMVSQGDIIFNVGEIPPKPKMIVVVSGQLSYLSLGATCGHSRGAMRRRRAVARETQSGKILDAGASISEAALWTHWMHRGILTALSDCRLCLLDAQKFGETVGQFDHDEFNPKLYAAQYVKGLNSRAEGLSDMPTGVEQDALDKLRKMVFKLRGHQRTGGRNGLGRRSSRASVVALFR